MNFNAKDAEEFAKERKDGPSLRPLRKTLRPLRLVLSICRHSTDFRHRLVSPWIS